MSLKLLQNLTKKAKILSNLCDGRTQHITFILDGKKILAVGWNSMSKTDAFAHRNGYPYPYIHSELHAIRNFKYKPSQLKGCTLVNIRIARKNGGLLNAKPCMHCRRLIKSFEIGKVIFSTKGGWCYD